MSVYVITMTVTLTVVLCLVARAWHKWQRESLAVRRRKARRAWGNSRRF